MKNKRINWTKLILLTVGNSALAAVGGSTIGETLGIVAANPKNAGKLALAGAVLGAMNLLLTVQREAKVNEVVAEKREENDEKANEAAREN
jgi:hypothetical protein